MPVVSHVANVFIRGCVIRVRGIMT